MRKIALIVILLIMCGCTNVYETPKPNMRDHYITFYEECCGITLSKPDKGENIIDVTFDVSAVYTSNEQRFQECKAFFGDSGFNGTTFSPISTYANIFDGIDFISNADFGEIKAGNSLASVVVYRNASALRFVESDYQVGRYNWDYYPEPAKDDEYAEELLLNGYAPRMSGIDKGFLPIIKPLEDVTEKDMWLMAPDFLSIRFMEIPEIKSHRFTLTLTEGENTYQASLDYVFE